MAKNEMARVSSPWEQNALLRAEWYRGRGGASRFIYARLESDDALVVVAANADLARYLIDNHNVALDEMDLRVAELHESFEKLAGLFVG